MDRDDKILAYLQGRLASRERDQFERDMAADTGLRGEVTLMQSVRGELANAPKLPEPEELWERISDAIDQPDKAANDNRRPWVQLAQYAAVACIAVAVWQVVAVPRLGPDTGSEVFHTASETSDKFELQVKFRGTATMADVIAVLTDLGGTITDGPSALGIVRVSFASETRRQNAFEVLASQKDLVEFMPDP
ncbi:MAG: hypothetical protein ABJH07_07885 [Sedimentitalea sp.]|uniref:hypothetical protein n=1 Tax=Sedimentitalea sp. TaxID=2048915 RepID=UPI003263ADAF